MSDADETGIVLTSISKRIDAVDKELDTFEAFVRGDSKNYTPTDLSPPPLPKKTSDLLGSWQSLVMRSSYDLHERGVLLEKATTEALLDHLGVDQSGWDAEGDFEALRPTDTVIGLVAGLAGSLTSAGLEGPLAKIHDQPKGLKEDNPILWRISERLKHGGSPMDAVRGRKHRLKLGHDLLNPFEVWETLATQYGGHYGAALHWVKHMVCDSLSTEGLPLPGHSLFSGRLRDLMVNNLKPNEITSYFSVKSRDLIGAGLVSAILFAYHRYRIHSEGSPKQQNYRSYRIAMFAHGTCLITGLMLGMLNYGSLVLFGKNVLCASIYDMKITKKLDAQRHELLHRVSSPTNMGPPLSELISSIPDIGPFTIRSWTRFVGDVPVADNVVCED